MHVGCPSQLVVAAKHVRLTLWWSGRRQNTRVICGTAHCAQHLHVPFAVSSSGKSPSQGSRGGVICIARGPVPSTRYKVGTRNVRKLLPT